MAVVSFGETAATAQNGSDEPPGVWQDTNNPTAGYFDHAAVRLDGGGVLVTGGTTSESGQDDTAVYHLGGGQEPDKGSWDESVASMNHARRKHDMVKFARGENAGDVFVIGRNNGFSAPSPPEIYRPEADEWVRTPPSPLQKNRDTTLLGGPACDELNPPEWCDTVLVVGDDADGSSAAVLFDPDGGAEQDERVGAWRLAAAPTHVHHSLVTLEGEPCATAPAEDRPDWCGTVLATGSVDTFVFTDPDSYTSNSDESDVPAMEVFDPAAGDSTTGHVGQWTETGQLHTPRNEHSVTSLVDGRVLVAGGWRRNDDGEAEAVRTAEIYQPADGEWHETAKHQAPYRADPKATLLDDGTVLLAGGLSQHGCLGSAELFDPAGNNGEGAFVSAGHMHRTRDGHTLTRLRDGRVLTVGASAFCSAQAKGSAEVYTPSYANPPEAPPPDITEVEPNAGLVTGGTRVTITGTGLAGVSEVAFGGTAVPNEGVTVQSHTTITVEAPSGQPGTVAIQVANQAGKTSPGDDPQAAFTYVQRAGVWTEVDSLSPPPDSSGARAVPIADGEVLGLYRDADGNPQAARYDPEVGTFTDAANPPREPLLAAPVGDGQALVVDSGRGAVYDPAQNTWKDTEPSLLDHEGTGTATRLADGGVLVVETTPTGGRGSEVYDPGTNQWHRTGSPGKTAHEATATRLADGRVLHAGGGSGELNGWTNEAAIFDPEDQEWTDAPRMPKVHSSHAATRLADGRVLVAGGYSLPGGPQPFAEAFLPSTLTSQDQARWDASDALTHPRAHHTVTRLADGSVLAVGGQGKGAVERYRPELDRWEPTARLTRERFKHAAVALDEGDCGVRCGSVLALGGGGGGSESDFEATGSVELYTPRPQVTGVAPASASVGTEVTLTGYGFAGADEVSFGGTPAEFTVTRKPGTPDQPAEITATVPEGLSVDERVHVTVRNQVEDGDAELTSSTSNTDLFWVDPPLSGGGGDQQDDGGQNSGDVEAAELPGQVGDLAAEALSAEEVTLTWTAVGDGAGASAPGYVVKQSPTPITDEADFADAFALCGGVCEPDPVPQVGGDLSLTVLDLQPDTTYYYAVRARSAAGELGPLSNAARATTPSGETAAGDTGGGGAGRELVEAACGQDVAAASFTDRDTVPQAHRLGVDCAAALEVVAGFADGSYRPGLGVRRDQMASFVARSLQAADVALPEPRQEGFADVAADSAHGEAIHRLAAAGIVAGGPGQLSDDRYGPGQVIRRDQMASFLIRAAEFATGQQLAAGQGGGRFADVPASNVHADQVSAAAALELAQGYPDGTYQPARQVRRDQMATFVTRLLGSLTTGTLASATQ